ncbi:MAG: hypothetical protein LBR28_03860 [Bacteroidales bacterium]|jgi:hypothetical protein|nr:hypothetical protein [Bacteroidales bacterium]
MTKKLLFLAVAAFCTLVFTSCGGKSTNNSPTENTEAADTAVAKTADWLSDNWYWSNDAEELMNAGVLSLELQVADGKITGHCASTVGTHVSEAEIEGTVSGDLATVTFTTLCESGEERETIGRAEIKKLSENEIVWNVTQEADCGNYIINTRVLTKEKSDSNSAD